MENQLKEVHYFDRFLDGNVPPDFAEGYHRFFPRPEGAITGEWTPRYMFDPWSIRLLREAAPDARILVILRDPVERFRSGVDMRRRLPVARGRRLDEIGAAVARGAYCDQLRRVFDVYGREQVLVLQYERCAAQPLAEMERTLRFLGLDPAEARQPERERSRPARRKPELPGPLRDDLVARLRPDAERLAELCPEIDLSLWPSFAR